MTGTARLLQRSGFLGSGLGVPIETKQIKQKNRSQPQELHKAQTYIIGKFNNMDSFLSAAKFIATQTNRFQPKKRDNFNLLAFLANLLLYEAMAVLGCSTSPGNLLSATLNTPPFRCEYKPPRVNFVSGEFWWSINNILC